MWWDWELELSPHLFKRMLDRTFTELDVRDMLHLARIYRRDVVPGRWVIVSSHRRKPWEIIVEPDTEAELLVVITAYPQEEL